MDEIILFPSNHADYDFIDKRPFGSGRFSNVYLAFSHQIPTPRKRTIEDENLETYKVDDDEKSPESILPQIVAIKRPCRPDFDGIIVHEARILSYLSRQPLYNDVVVPFHGYDPRNRALVLTAIPYTLEDYISIDLESIGAPGRTSIMAQVFWNTARSLVNGLAWLHEADVVHGDIKPANILLQAATPMRPGERFIDPLGVHVSLFKPIIADFTSASYVSDQTSSSSSSNNSKNNSSSSSSNNSNINSSGFVTSGSESSGNEMTTLAGGGTYNYLAPEYLATTPTPPAAPGPWMDVYALAVTLLVLLTGRSPYAVARNRYQLLGMAKEGRPLDFAAMDDVGSRRLRAVRACLRDLDRLDPLPAIEAGLRVPPSLRVEARNWVAFFDPDKVKVRE